MLLYDVVGNGVPPGNDKPKPVEATPAVEPDPETVNNVVTPVGAVHVVLDEVKFTIVTVSTMTSTVSIDDVTLLLSVALNEIVCAPLGTVTENVPEMDCAGVIVNAFHVVPSVL